ncbi:MAG: hypothetical protein LBJ00_16910 [Planctomycetaceae bacterium]|nr:hypothetical protein [Planctomycetaceae bacterium]
MYRMIRAWWGKCVANSNFPLPQTLTLYSSRFKTPEAEHASVTSRSGCSRAKPAAHAGFG